MKERPIIFSGPMIRAILAGRKTQTRRLLGLSKFRTSETPGYDWTFRGRAPIRSIAGQRRHPSGCWQDLTEAQLLALCPYGVPGDRLWVRETFTATRPGEPDEGIEYAADWLGGRPGFAEDDWTWTPSIFMPRRASRITVEIASVRVQRLQDISEAEVLAEGVDVPLAAKLTNTPWGHIPDLYRAWRLVWDHINGERAPWESNPWVWAITFKTIDPASADDLAQKGGR